MRHQQRTFYRPRTAIGLALAGLLVATTACKAPSSNRQAWTTPPVTITSSALALASVGAANLTPRAIAAPVATTPIDQASLQALIDTRYPPCGVCSNDKGGIVRFTGEIVLKSPLKLYSGVTLEGTGPGSILRTSSDFQGSEVITLVAIRAGQTPYYANGALRNFTIIGPTSGDVAAIAVSPPSPIATEPSTNVINSVIENLVIGAPLGIRINYAQHFVLRRLQVVRGAPIAQFIDLRGNHNLIESIDLTGANLIDPSLPLITVGRSWDSSSANTLRHVVFAGSPLAGKRSLLIDDTIDTVLDQVWFQYDTTEAPLELRKSSNLTLVHMQFGVRGPKMIIDNAVANIDRLDIGSQTVASAITFRNSGWLSTDLLAARDGAAAAPLNLPFSAAAYTNVVVPSSTSTLISSLAPTTPPTPGSTTNSYHNASSPMDVDNDGSVSPLDTLVLIDSLNAKGARVLAPSEFNAPPYVDVNGDGSLSPLDVLALIDYLNSRASGG